MTSSINWFEIPANDFLTAKSFYEKILEIKIMVMPHPVLQYGIFSYDMQKGGIGGAIVQGDGFEPSLKGSLIYLNAGDDLSIALNKVEEAGGKIVIPKISIGQNGFMAHFIDTEGNKVALHSMK